VSDDALFSSANLREALRQPRWAFGTAIALLRGRWVAFRCRMKGVRIAVGRNFRCYGRVVIAGRGTLAIGDDVVFRQNLSHVYLGSAAGGWTISIGSRVWLHGTSISCRDRVTIGDRALVGRVEIVDHEFHDPRDFSRKQQIRTAPIVLGNDTWIGNGCMILKGVTIGDYSVVGARTVVRKSLPPKIVAIGNPAQIVKHLA
jgi:acetyltransferase-like isoleucine patch superfamily enzyme